MSQKKNQISLTPMFPIVIYVFFLLISFDDLHVCQNLGQEMVFCLEDLEFIRTLSVAVMGLDAVSSEAVCEKKYTYYRMEF